MEMSGNTPEAYLKTQIREKVKAARAAMPAEKEQFLNEQLFSCMSRQLSIAGAEAVYTYISCNREADTHRLTEWLWERGILVAAPRVQDAGRMEFYRICSWQDLESGRMGIWEPRQSCPAAGHHKAVVITPGLAFDRSGHRIGYGGGYYDRFLAREPQHRSIGLAFDFQLYEALPYEAYDRTLDQLMVSGEREAEVYEFNRNRETGEAGSDVSE